jgi:hypothetical protein
MKGMCEAAAVISRATVLTLLMIPCLETDAATWQSQSVDSQEIMSREFLQSASSALVAIHQAKENIATLVSKNLPNSYYDPRLASHAYDQVRQSQIAATTHGDQQAATLLNSYFGKVKAWADQHKEDRQSLNATRTMGEDSLANDDDWQTIQACEKGLNQMLMSRSYTDVRECR